MSHDIETTSVKSKDTAFLDEKQQEVKQKMMEDLVEAFFGNIQKNKDAFTTKDVINLASSVLIMFNREILVHMLTTFHLVNNRKDIMKALFESIKNEVNHKIKQGMQ